MMYNSPATTSEERRKSPERGQWVTTNGEGEQRDVRKIIRRMM